MSWVHRCSGLVLALGFALALACGGREESSDDQYHRARNAFAERRYDLARVYYASDLASSDLANHPPRLESLRGLALAWLSGPGQSLEPALPALERYLEQVADDPEISHRYIKALLLLGDGLRATSHAAQLEPGVEQALLLAEALALANPHEAWEALAPCLDTEDGRRQDARCQALAASIAHQLDDRRRAQQHAEWAARLDPLAPANWYLLGRLRLSAGQREAAKRALEIHAGLTEMSHGGPQGGPLSAIESLRVLRSLAHDLPDSLAIRLRQARLRLEAGFVDQALLALPDLIEDPALSVDERLGLADLLLRRDQRNLAEQLFRQALAEQPASQHARAGLASTLLASDQLDEARELLLAGLELDPHLARYHLLLGRLEQVTNNLGGARRSLSRALDLAPWNVPWRLELAKVLLTAGDRQAASSLLDRAPQNTAALDNFRRHQRLAPKGKE